MGSPGIEVRPLREITGDASFNQVFLDNVFVPDDCLVGEVNGGWRIARTTLANERVSLSRSWTFGVGVAELIEVARAAAEPPLGDVGRLVCEGRADRPARPAGHAQAAVGHRARIDWQRPQAAQHAQRAADRRAVLVDGRPERRPRGSAVAGCRPAGAPDGAQWARQTLQTRAVTIGGGTTDIQLNIIAERMLGLPRDPDPPKTIINPFMHKILRGL